MGHSLVSSDFGAAQVLRLQLQDHHGIMAGVAKLNVVRTESAEITTLSL